MRDMQVSGDGRSAQAKVPQSALDKYLGEGADESEESDEGEVIDKSAFSSSSFSGSRLISLRLSGSRTDYYDLPQKKKRGSAPGGTEGDDGTLWPAP